MDVKRTEMKPSDHYIQINGGWSIVLLALALAWQQLDSYEEYFAAVEEFNGAVKHSHVEILDPNKFLLVEEKKKAEESRLITQYESKKIEVLYHLDPNVPKEVLGDQFRLEHVLGNLLSNAIKFSDRESTIEVSVTYETKLKGHITFTVKDQGPGMSSDEQKMLFQPFMQIRPGELQKGRGSGLGLSICKTIVSLHNGTIGCTSKQRVGSDRLSGGSEFYFSIDFKEPDRPSTISPSGHESGNVEDREEEPAAGGGDDADHHDDVLPSTSKGNEEGSTDDTTLLRTTHQQQQQSQSKTNEVSHENVGLLSTFSRESSGSCTVTPRSSIDMLDIPSARAIKSMRQHHSTPMNVNTNTNSPAEMNSIQRPTSITSPSGSSRGGEGNVFEDASSSSSSSNSGRIPQEVGEKLSSSLPTIMESSGNSTPLIEAGSSLTATPNPASTPLARGSGSMSGNSLLTPEKTADVLSNRKMLEMILRKRGFKCDQCADGIEAVQLFQEKGCDYYDLVFMDSVMPIMCGPEAAQKIRALGYSKLLIGVTGNAMDVDVIDYETSGADLILTKPMRMEALQKLLDYCDRFGCQSHHKRDIPMEQRAKTWVFSC
eukprot:scaffold2431_cov185-Ochromonas_danica.AAC.5